LLLAYFIPALLNWPLGLIAPHWYGEGLADLLANYKLQLPAGASYEEINAFLADSGVPSGEYKDLQKHSSLYFVASRYLLPASLILLCLGIDLKALKNLGKKPLIMFFAATTGIIIGGPIALLLVSSIAPGVIGGSSDEIWRGFSTVFLLYGANISDKVDGWLKADNSAIEELKTKIADYRSSISEMPTTTTLFIILAFAFGGVALSHWIADFLTPLFVDFNKSTMVEIGIDELGKPKLSPGILVEKGASSLMSHFFWLIVVSTTFGLFLSFTKARKMEGVGASRWGSIFIYILVVTIGMKMNLGEVFQNLGLFSVGIVWMLVHVTILLLVAKLIKAPFFFVAVGSQANIGGAASAPIVASAFSPSLAPVGVLMAVLGYALGTYGAIICASLMQYVSG